MFNWKSTPDPDSLDYLIDEVQIEMRALNAETEEFKLALGRLKELHKLKDDNRPRRVSPDTMAIVAANLLGILIITQHENAHAMGTKALGFVKRLP